MSGRNVDVDPLHDDGNSPPRDESTTTTTTGENATNVEMTNQNATTTADVPYHISSSQEGEATATTTTTENAAAASSSSATKTTPSPYATKTDAGVKSVKAAKNAFADRDVDASRAEHEKNEPHGAASGEIVKAVVFGGLDGIGTVFAVVTAAAGAGWMWNVILVFGLARLFAGAWAMGFGEFLGGMAEYLQAVSEREREEWECEVNFEEEKQELKLIYLKRGYPEEDAESLVGILARNKKLFVDTMMKDELGITTDLDDKMGPMKNGGAMFLSFVLFGVIPVIPYMFGGDNSDNSNSNNNNTSQQEGAGGTDKTFIVSCALTGIALLILGVIKGYLTDRPLAQMALAMLFSGIISGLVAYVVSATIAIMV